MKNKLLLLSGVIVFGVAVSYASFGWSEPTGNMPTTYTPPLNTSATAQDVAAGKPVVANFNADKVDGFHASDLLAASSSGASCPNNYGNLCKEGGGLEFVYNGKTLHIDAYPRAAGGVNNEEWAYVQAIKQCADIGGRVPTKQEFQAACSALGGPNGNGMTSFNNSLTERWEFTSTPGGSNYLYVIVAAGASCSTFAEQAVYGFYTANAYSQGTYYAWFRCIR